MAAMVGHIVDVASMSATHTMIIIDEKSALRFGKDVLSAMYNILNFLHILVTAPSLVEDPVIMAGVAEVVLVVQEAP